MFETTGDEVPAEGPVSGVRGSEVPTSPDGPTADREWESNGAWAEHDWSNVPVVPRSDDPPPGWEPETNWLYEIDGIEQGPVAWFDHLAPSGRLMTELEKLPTEMVDTDADAVEMVAHWARLEAHCAMQKRRSAAALSRRTSMAEGLARLDDLGVRTHESNIARDELSLRLGIGRYAAQTLVRSGRAFDGVAIPTCDALEAGEIDAAKADVIVAGIDDLEPEAALEVQDRVLRKAPHITTRRLRRELSAARAAVDPEYFEQRCAIAAEKRRVSEPRVLPDGMASLYAEMPAVEAIQLYRALDGAARSAKAGGDLRTLDQLRADALALVGTAAIETGSIGVCPRVHVDDRSRTGCAPASPHEVGAGGPADARLAAAAQDSPGVAAQGPLGVAAQDSRGVAAQGPLGVAAQGPPGAGTHPPGESAERLPSTAAHGVPGSRRQHPPGTAAAADPRDGSDRGGASRQPRGGPADSGTGDPDVERDRAGRGTGGRLEAPDTGPTNDAREGLTARREGQHADHLAGADFAGRVGEGVDHVAGAGLAGRVGEGVDHVAGAGLAGRGGEGVDHPGRLAGCGMRVGAIGGRSAHVRVVVPLTSMMGGIGGPGEDLPGADDPAELEGYGPIPASVARALAAGGPWARMVTDPVDGTVLELSRDRYEPTAEMADLVRARERECVHLTCGVSSDKCDLHHRIPWPIGATSVTNFDPGCRRDHLLITHGGWSYEIDSQGRRVWTTPTGLRYVAEQDGSVTLHKPGRLPPPPPPPLDDDTPPPF